MACGGGVWWFCLYVCLFVCFAYVKEKQSAAQTLNTTSFFVGGCWHDTDTKETFQLLPEPGTGENVEKEIDGAVGVPQNVCHTGQEEQDFFVNGGFRRLQGQYSDGTGENYKGGGHGDQRDGHGHELPLPGVHLFSLTAVQLCLGDSQGLKNFPDEDRVAQQQEAERQQGGHQQVLPCKHL